MKKIIDARMALYSVFAVMFMVLLVADENVIGLVILGAPIALYIAYDWSIEKIKKMQ